MKKFPCIITQGQLIMPDKEALKDYLKTIEGKREFILGTPKELRSLAQNNYWWACMTELGKHIGYNNEQMSAIVKDHLGWYEDFFDKLNNKTTRLYQSSADWTKKEFAENTEHLRQFGDEQGCYLPTPDEYLNFNTEAAEK